MQKIYEELLKNMPHTEVKKDEPMSKHTSFRVGGLADIWIKVKNIDELEFIIKYVKEKEIPMYIIGNGTNTLVKDSGIRGIVINPDFDYINVEEQGENVKATVGAGVKLPMLANTFMKKEIEGLEFASGIPGTIGGAIRMNAGAYGGEMQQIVESVRYMDEEGNIKNAKVDELDFSYRYSRFKENREIIIDATLNIKKGKYEEIKEKMNDFNNKRIEKQPLNMPSAGSTFKRGNGFITSQLIDEAGLKGFQIGGAMVSEKHAGFIVNTGNATADDILKLTDYIIKKVYEKYGKILELEIEIFG